MSPFIKNPAADPVLPVSTSAAMSAPREGRPVDPAESPRLRLLVDRMLPAAAAARRLVGEEPDGASTSAST
ncbi:MAG TPA: hypothetical protein VL551_34510 [Actinospica sp.]|nr:hypothetical protein [Actinospica sp.]